MINYAVTMVIGVILEDDTQKDITERERIELEDASHLHQRLFEMARDAVGYYVHDYDLPWKVKHYYIKDVHATFLPPVIYPMGPHPRRASKK